MIAGRRVDEELYAELEARADLAAGDPAAAEADRAASRLLGVGASLLLISLFVLSSSVDLLQSLPGPLVGASAPEGTSNGATGGVPRADSAPAGQRPSDPPGTEAGSADGTTGGGAGQLPSTPGGQPGGPGQPDQPPWVPQPGTTTPTPGVPSAPEQPPDPGAPAQPPANPDTVVVLRLSDDDGDRPMFSLPAMVPGSLVRRGARAHHVCRGPARDVPGRRPARRRGRCERHVGLGGLRLGSHVVSRRASGGCSGPFQERTGHAEGAVPLRERPPRGVRRGRHRSA